MRERTPIAVGEWLGKWFDTPSDLFIGDVKNIRRGRTLIVVEHDMDAMFELAERITVLHEGALLAEGTPAEIQRNSLVQEAYLGGVAAA